MLSLGLDGVHGPGCPGQLGRYTLVPERLGYATSLLKVVAVGKEIYALCGPDLPGVLAEHCVQELAGRVLLRCVGGLQFFRVELVCVHEVVPLEVRQVTLVCVGLQREHAVALVGGLVVLVRCGHGTSVRDGPTQRQGTRTCLLFVWFLLCWRCSFLAISLVVCEIAAGLRKASRLSWLLFFVELTGVDLG